MNRGNKLWEGHRMILPEHRARLLEQERTPYVPALLYDDLQEEIEYKVQEAMLHRKTLTFIVGEADGEHQVEGKVTGYRAEQKSLQINNEWGRFLIPLSSIVRVL